MPLFLPPRTSPTASIGICARCGMKNYSSELKADPNIPGLHVCKGCADEYDPYRLAARQPEDISVKNPQPDEKLS